MVNCLNKSITLVFLCLIFVSELHAGKGKIEVDARLLDNCKIEYQISNNADFTLSRLRLRIIYFNEFGMPVSEAESLDTIIRRNEQVNDYIPVYQFLPKYYSCDDVTRFEIYVTTCLSDANEYSTTDCVNSVVIEDDLLPQLTKLETDSHKLTLKQIGFQDTKNDTCQIWYRFNNKTDDFEISYHFSLSFTDIYDGYAGRIDPGFVGVPPNSSDVNSFFAPIPCDEIKDIKFTSNECATYEYGSYGYCPESVKLIPSWTFENPKPEGQEYGCLADHYGKETYDRALAAYKFSHHIKDLFESRDLDGIYQLIDGEPISGPRRKRIANKLFSDFFTEEYADQVALAEAVCQEAGMYGYYLHGVWFKETDDGLKIYSLPNAINDSEEISADGWIQDGNQLSSRCFIFNDFSNRSGSFEEYASHFGISNYHELSRSPGVFFGRSVKSYDDVVLSSGESFNLIVPTTSCVSNMSVDGVDEYPYRLLREVDKEVCNSLAPAINLDCERSYLIEINDYRFRASGIYGLFDFPNFGYAIVPLKIFNTVNEGLSFIDP